MFKKKFYYGDKDDHIVKMTENQAKAVNASMCEDEGEIEYTATGAKVKVTLILPDDCTIDDYNSAVKILNQYLDAGNSVYYDDFSKDILRPVK